ncbi:MAG: response regulator [Deltaproteobacteria bacterium]|nr:response regulator [Deltaproteobacteria bacterium]NCP03434.1 response regulator [Deltaproteobacteria bacterium]
MTRPKTPVAATEQILRERNLYLEEANRQYVSLLDTLATSRGFQQELAHAETSHGIYTATLTQIDRFLPFEAIGCLHADADGAFVLDATSPFDETARLQEETDNSIMNGAFAWALDRNQPMITPSRQGALILLHAISTYKNVYGMFIGLLPLETEHLDATLQNVLTIILYTAANALESLGYRTQLRQHLATLEERVGERTAELSAALQRAEGANKAKGDFLATVSHEIRTPMNGVVGMTSLLLDSQLSEDQREYAEAIRISGESLMSLINDVLDFSKIESGQLELDEQTFDLRQLLQNCERMVQSRVKAAGLCLQWRTAPGVPQNLRGDSGRLRQILLNLFGNAIKFTPAGKIDVQVELAESFEDFLVLKFLVRDSGVGIAVARQTAIFEPFTQADGSTTRKYGGTGLGLAICRQLVELMHGEIGVISAPGEGATFWFTARFSYPHAAVPAPGVSILPTSLASSQTPCVPQPDIQARILLVEDNLINQKVALRMLSKWGYNADVASDGRKAVEALQQKNYDLVLMDCMMPEMDGFAATRLIRDPSSAVSNHRVPIVAMTANAMKGDREKCLQSGMDDYLAKPIDREELAQMLVKWLGSGEK